MGSVSLVDVVVRHQSIFEYLSKTVKGIVPKKPSGFLKASLASLFNTMPLKQDPAPLLIGERSNATGSKAFRETAKSQ